MEIKSEQEREMVTADCGRCLDLNVPICPLCEICFDCCPHEADDFEPAIQHSSKE